MRDLSNRPQEKKHQAVMKIKGIKVLGVKNQKMGAWSLVS
jgi:hypothetical protein